MLQHKRRRFTGGGRGVLGEGRVVGGTRAGSGAGPDGAAPELLRLRCRLRRQAGRQAAVPPLRACAGPAPGAPSKCSPPAWTPCVAPRTLPPPCSRLPQAGHRDVWARRGARGGLWRGVVWSVVAWCGAVRRAVLCTYGAGVWAAHDVGSGACHRPPSAVPVPQCVLAWLHGCPQAHEEGGEGEDEVWSPRLQQKRKKRGGWRRRGSDSEEEGRSDGSNAGDKSDEEGEEAQGEGEEEGGGEKAEAGQDGEQLAQEVQEQQQPQDERAAAAAPAPPPAASADGA